MTDPQILTNQKNWYNLLRKKKNDGAYIVQGAVVTFPALLKVLALLQKKLSLER